MIEPEKDYQQARSCYLTASGLF